MLHNSNSPHIKMSCLPALVFSIMQTLTKQEIVKAKYLFGPSCLKHLYFNLLTQNNDLYMKNTDKILLGCIVEIHKYNKKKRDFEQKKAIFFYFQRLILFAILHELKHIRYQSQ